MDTAPAVYAVTCRSVCTPCASIWSRVTTLMACGVSMSGVSVLVALSARWATKPVTGAVGFSCSAPEDTVTGASVASAVGDGTVVVCAWAAALHSTSTAACATAVRGVRHARDRDGKGSMVCY